MRLPPPRRGRMQGRGSRRCAEPPRSAGRCARAGPRSLIRSRTCRPATTGRRGMPGRCGQRSTTSSGNAGADRTGPARHCFSLLTTRALLYRRDRDVGPNVEPSRPRNSKTPRLNNLQGAPPERGWTDRRQRWVGARRWSRSHGDRPARRSPGPTVAGERLIDTER